MGVAIARVLAQPGTRRPSNLGGRLGYRNWTPNAPKSRGGQLLVKLRKSQNELEVDDDCAVESTSRYVEEDLLAYFFAGDFRFNL